MLKGVNKQVVEICEPESIYFERVLFFVKPEFYGLGESRLRKKADELMYTEIKLPKSKRPGRTKLIAVLKTAAAVFAGAVSTLLTVLLIR